MRRLPIAALLTVLLPAPTALAHDDERVFHQASELVPWCRQEAEAHYIGQGMTPYQWAASYHDRGNVLYVEGRLRVHSDDVAVRCRVARGARERYAVIEIDDPASQAAVAPDHDGDVQPVRAAQPVR